MTPTGALATTLNPILLAIRQRVMDVLGFPVERVLIDARRSVKKIIHTQADQYIRLRVLGGPADGDWVGHGRVGTVATRKVRATVWTRLALDTTAEDAIILTDTSLGHFKAEHALWDALLSFQPALGDGRWLVVEPIEPGPAGEPEASDEADAWLSGSVEFSVKYLLDLNPNYQ